MAIVQNEHLNTLVQELSKKNPNAEIIKKKTDVLGIPYSNDLIILMSEVLVFISNAEKLKVAPKDKTV